MDVLVNWFRSRAARRAEPPCQHCTGCRSSVLGATDDELRASGGVFLAGAGWFCGPRCERQYRLRFHIQSTPTPAGGAAAGPARMPTGRATPQALEALEDPDRRPAVDELARALRARRRRSGDAG